MLRHNRKFAKSYYPKSTKYKLKFSEGAIVNRKYFYFKKFEGILGRKNTSDRKHVSLPTDPTDEKNGPQPKAYGIHSAKSRAHWCFFPKPIIRALAKEPFLRLQP